MAEYSVTRIESSVNKWKNEGALIAGLGMLLLAGVILAGGEILAVAFFIAIIFLGFLIYSNNTVTRSIGYSNPAYTQQGSVKLQPGEWQQSEEWETRPRWNLNSQQWQNQNVQRRNLDNTVTDRW